MNRFHESGQIGLIVLLISAVMMTIGLGVASQSVFESKSARQEVESTQTFNAAEQGLEEALSNIATINTIQTLTAPDGSIVQFRNTEVRGFDGRTIGPGKSTEVKLDGDSLLNISWTSTAPCSAIIVTVIGSTLNRNAYRSPGCPATDGFNVPAICSNGGCTINNVLMPSNPALARIKVVYGSATISVSGTLPVQGIRSESTATGPSGTITLDQVTYAALPSIFDYVLFSGNGNIPQ